MAKPAISADDVKAFLKSQYCDEEKWAHNVKLSRALGLFAAAIVLMRNFGDLMAV